MGAFCVYGVSLSVCRQAAERQLPCFMVPRGREGRLRDCTAVEWGVKRDELAAKLFSEQTNQVKISPEFDAPEFAVDWMSIDPKHIRLARIMVRGQKTDNKGNPVYNDGMPVETWVDYPANGKTRLMALSVRQPWAWLIVNGYKSVENRTWATARRGPILIHASKGMTKGEYTDVEKMLAADHRLQHIKLPDRDQLERGGIVGMATITDCVETSDSPFFSGPYGFTLAGAAPLPFIEFKGTLHFFEVPDGVLP